MSGGFSAKILKTSLKKNVLKRRNTHNLQNDKDHRRRFFTKGEEL